MRKVTKISKAYRIVEEGFMSVNEKFVITEMIDLTTEIVDRRVGHMVDNRQFKEYTRKVADFIDSISGEIIDTVLDYFSDPTDYDYEARREMVEAYLYCEKAKAAGIYVPESEVDARMLTTSSR